MKYILGILLAVIILLFNFRLIVYDEDFYNDDNINSSDYVNNLIGYFKGYNQLDSKYFNEKEIIHLKDVRNLINFFIYLFYFLILIFILLLFKFYKNIFSVFIIAFLIILLISIFIYIFDFSNLFYKFHLLAFKNDFWILNPKTDNLINFFPESFFYNVLMKILINSFLMSFVLCSIGIYNVKKHLKFSL